MQLMEDSNLWHCQIIDGRRLPRTFSAEIYRSGLRYKPENGDIFIAEFPKCGAHWVTELLAASFQVCKGLEPGDTFLEKFGMDGILDAPKPRIVRTHLPPNLVPYSSNAKYIVLLRNPKDCCVSLYNRAKSQPTDALSDVTFDEFFELFVNGLTYFGSYFEFVRSWWAERHDPKALFITYESMHADIRGSVLKITDFVDHAMSKELRESEAKMKAVLKRIELPSMKAKYAAQFVRKGVVGDWKNFLSPDQARCMEKTFFREMKGTSIPDLWKDVDWLL